MQGIILACFVKVVFLNCYLSTIHKPIALHKCLKKASVWRNRDKWCDYSFSVIVWVALPISTSLGSSCLKSGFVIFTHMFRKCHQSCSEERHQNLMLQGVLQSESWTQALWSSSQEPLANEWSIQKQQAWALSGESVGKASYTLSPLCAH